MNQSRSGKVSVSHDFQPATVVPAPAAQYGIRHAWVRSEPIGPLRWTQFNQVITCQHETVGEIDGEIEAFGHAPANNRAGRIGIDELVKRHGEFVCWYADHGEIAPTDEAVPLAPRECVTEQPKRASSVNCTYS